jgi:hypothetical protein
LRGVAVFFRRPASGHTFEREPFAAFFHFAPIKRFGPMQAVRCSCARSGKLEFESPG